MGYEHRIFIARKTENNLYNDGFFYASTIATFDLGKLGKTDIMYFFSDDSKYYVYYGNERTTKDYYGENLRQCSIQDFLKFCKFYSNKEYYKTTLKPVEAFLKSIVKYDNPDEYIVIHMGY